jgi:DNA-binding SARP family transcriptional activator/regulation of enolase protein 1 (concanavalin A-like superfamily)
VTELLHIQLLGEFRISFGDKLLETLSSPRLQSILAYLLLHRGAPQSRQHIAFTFWPDSIESQARTNLRKLLYDLRRALPEADAYLYADTQTVRWSGDAPLSLDVADLEEALEDATAAAGSDDRRAASQALERAVERYAGDLLPSCYDDWIRPERERLRARYLDALEQLAQLLEDAGDTRAAIEHTQRLLRHDPLHEPAYRRLMRLHAAQGDRAGALHVYHTCVTVLERELGVEPAEATQRAYQRLLEAEAALPQTAIGRTETAALPEMPSTPSAPLTPIPGLVASVPLVGRHPEWAQLLGVWQRAAQGASHVVLVEGEAGIGKSRLAGELARWLARQGVRAAAARCYAAEGALPYAPVVAWLRALPPPQLAPAWLSELARLLPELLNRYPQLPRLGPMTESWQRQRLFEALAHAMLDSGQPLLLVLDDLQWCDADTREWLHYLLRYDPQAPLLVVGTVRSEELDEQHPLHRWMQALRHDGQLVEVELDRLDEEDTLDLAERVAAHDLSPELASCIYAETEGNPLYILEVVRAGLAVDELQPLCPLQELPPRVQGAIEARLGQLSPEARAFAEVAATVGRSFSLELLLASTSLEEDAAVVALDELWRRRVVAEQGEAGYDFTHDKLREVAYAGLSPVRCRQLHGRLGRALAALHAGDLDPVAAEIASHWDQAGQPAQAIPHYLRAAEVARRIYATGEAIARYERALALIPNAAPPNRAGWRLEAAKGLGQVYLGLGKVREAEGALREAIALGQQAGLAPREMARLYYWLGESLWWQNRNDEQIRIGKEGLALLGDESESVEAILMNGVMGSGHFNKGNFEKCRECNSRTAKFIRRLPYVEELRTGYLHIAVAMLYMDKNPAEAMAWLQALEKQAEPHRDLRALGEVHGWAGRILEARGDLHGAVARHRQALELLSQTGDGSLESWSLDDMSTDFLSLGDLKAAEEYAAGGLHAAERAGNDLTIGQAYWCIGRILLAQGAPEEAVAALEKAVQPVVRKTDYRWGEAYALGQAYLAQGNSARAIQEFQEVATLAGAEDLGKYTLELATSLSGLEEAYGDSSAFRAFCRGYQGDHPQTQRLPFVQWYLEPVDVDELRRGSARLRDRFAGELVPDWRWEDPFEDCSYAVQNGLEIRAANGRHLWRVNLSAPRLLRQASGDLAAQATCEPVLEDRPAIGGLLLWKDEQHYLHLDWGLLGESDVSFMGCIDNRDVVIGRGRLPRHGRAQVHLRLERVGDEVRAFCSADGEQWFAVGHVPFPVEDPIQVGLHAIGSIDRTIYRGAYPEGTAIRYASFQLGEI